MFTGIPNVVQWIELTTHSWTLFHPHTRDIAGMTLIDAALRKYQNYAAVPFDRSSESEAAKGRYNDLMGLRLLDIMSACRARLTQMGRRHRDKKAVGTLFQQAMARAQKRHGLQAIERDTAAKINWRILKEDVTRLGIGQGKALDSEYWLESSVANPNHYRGGDISGEWERSGEDSFFMFMHRDMERLEDELVGVKYVTEGDRWKYNIVFDEGLVYKRARQDSFDTGIRVDTGSGVYLFIIDLHDNCYLSFGETKGGVEQGYKFHHSSIPAGKAVAFAGAMKVKNGTVLEVDGCSGHYKPEKRHLIHALKVLEENDVNLDDVTVMYFDGVQIMGGMPVPNIAVEPNGQRFLDLNR